MNDKNSRRAWRVGVSSGLCCVVLACGGGAADVPVNGASVVVAPVAASTSTAVFTPLVTKDGIDASCGQNGNAGFRAEVLQRVNALRAAGAVCGTVSYGPAVALNWDDLLQKAASEHSADMAQNNYFSHDSLNGKTMGQRLLDAGYSYSAAAENIAAGDTSVESVVTRWLNSPGHCVNMMNPVYRDVGVACVRNDAAAYGNYWTMDLGRS